MSKSNTDKKRLSKEREAHKRVLKKIRRITAIVTLSVIAVIAAVIAAAVGVYNARLNSGEHLRGEIAAASKNHEIDGCMMNYYFNDTYNTFVEYFGSYVEYLGLDTTMPLREQEISDGESWFDYLMSGTRTTTATILALNEMADVDGITLTDEEKTAIKNRSYSTDEGLYGRGVNHDDICNAKALEALAYKYQFIKESELMPTDEEIEAYYEQNSNRYQSVDYYAFPLYYPAEESETTTSSGARRFTEAEIIEFANELAAVTSPEDFELKVRELLLIEDPDMSEDDLSSALASVKNTGMLYTEGDGISEWAFSAKNGETMIIADTENTVYTVYMLTAEPYRDESDTINMRLILLYDSTAGSREKTLEKANKLLSAYENGAKTPEAFGLLALEHSEAQGSYYSGGKYEYVVKGRNVEVLDSWCFDESRKLGDTAVIEADNGCYVVLYEGKGPAAWKASIASTMIGERTEEFLAEITERYPVLFDENVIDMIPD